MKNSFKTLMLLPMMALVVMTGCKKDEEEKPELKSQTFNYAFNTGQVGAGTAYDGSHAKNLTASLKLEEQSDGKTRITLNLMNTMDGMMYHVHAHDAADPSTTPNGTPYNETPNALILVGHVGSSGGMATYTQVSDMSFAELTTQYSGFLVVHDPTQALSTTDLTTYLVVGAFAR